MVVEGRDIRAYHMNAETADALADIENLAGGAIDSAFYCFSEDGVDRDTARQLVLQACQKIIEGVEARVKRVLGPKIAYTCICDGCRAAKGRAGKEEHKSGIRQRIRQAVRLPMPDAIDTLIVLLRSFGEDDLNEALKELNQLRKGIKGNADPTEKQVVAHMFVGAIMLRQGNEKQVRSEFNVVDLEVAGDVAKRIWQLPGSASREEKVKKGV